MTTVALQCTCGQSVSVEQSAADDPIDCPACNHPIFASPADLFSGTMADPIAQVTQQVPAIAALAKSTPVLSYAKLTADPVVTPRAIDLLRQLAHWSRVMALLMIFAAMGMIVLGVVLLTLGLWARNPAALLALVYPPAGLISLIPARYVMRFASNAGIFVQLRHENSLEAALEAQKSYWKFVAVLSLFTTFMGLAAATAFYLKTML